MGGDSTCSSGEYCISKAFNTPGGSDTSMSHGWTYTWNEPTLTFVSLQDQKYSNDGGAVGDYAASIRNRSTTWYTMCVYRDGNPLVLQQQAKFSGETWKNLATPSYGDFLFIRQDQGNCASSYSNPSE